MESGVCVITGGSRGIGAATARRVAAAGYGVCLSYRSDQAAAEAVAAEVGGVAVRADVAVEDDVVALFRAADDLGPVTAAVANAGIVGPSTSVRDLGAERVRRILEVNVLGLVLTCREAVRRPTMRAVVTVSSIASRLGSPNEYVDYAASKGAVDTFTIGLAREVAADGIRVNCVRPGIIQTDIHEEGRVERIAPTIPARRAGDPDEVAAAIAWLLSGDAGYCNGTIVDVNGGR
jgi:NAD(P)-dependent dehydrogenase (short-subunit alcohol dehydrogenase family)